MTDTRKADLPDTQDRPRRQRRRTGLYLVYRFEFHDQHPGGVFGAPIWGTCGVGAKASRERQWGMNTLQYPPRFTWYGGAGLSYEDAKALKRRLQREQP